jgi:integrase
MQLMILFAAVASLRRTEGLNLVVSDIEFSGTQNYVHIRPKSYTDYTWEWGAKHRFGDYDEMVGIPKTIELPTMIVDFDKLLIEHIEALPNRQPYVCVPPRYYVEHIKTVRQTGQLAWAARNCPWPAFSNRFSYRAKRAGIVGKTFHDLRDTCATALHDNGFSLVQIQKHLRHKNITTTAGYIGVESKLPQQTAAATKVCYSV